MKKVCGFVLMMVVGVALAAESIMYIHSDVFSSTTILGGANAVSAVYKLSDYKPSGFFSLQLKNTQGTVAYVQVEITNDEVSWVPATLFVGGVFTNRIFEAFTSTSGPSGDGVSILGIGIPLCKAARVRCYATDTAIVTAALAIQ